MNQEQLHKYGVIEAIKDLHENVTGSSDTLNYGEFSMVDLYEVLQERRKNWRPSIIDRYAKYDNFVFNVLETVLIEFEQYNGDN